MSLAAKALWIMERNSDQPLNLGELARACGVSRSHLAHAFGSSTGIPAMKYLRSRRLSRAAETLAAGAPDILTVALDAGYNSHEAFTRAFREQFEITPESVRERGRLDGLPIASAIPLKPLPNRPPLRYRFQHQGAILAVGLSGPFDFDSTIGIPAQWQRFMQGIEDIAYQSEDIPIGITQAPDEDGQFTYVCAIEVARLGDIPSGFEAIRIAPARYAVFEHNEHVSTIFKTYERIWNEALPAAGLGVADAPVIERHNPTFDPATGEGGLTLWVPLAETPTEPADPTALQRNRTTVASYDRYAQGYADATRDMSEAGRQLLDRFGDTLAPGSRVLEIGSGPGWDADYLEGKQLNVRRTDAAPAFVAMQLKRGKPAESLDVVTDDLGGPWDGVLMMYVLQHIEGDLIGPVLRRIATSLKPRGSLMFSFRQGNGSFTEHGEQSGDYHTTLRSPASIRTELRRAGLTIDWEHEAPDEDGDWRIILASRGG